MSDAEIVPGEIDSKSVDDGEVDDESGKESVDQETQGKGDGQAAETNVPKKVDELGEIVRNADKTVRVMTHYEAESFCKEDGKRLPTAREFAVIASELGAKGVRETELSNLSVRDERLQEEIFRMRDSGYLPVYRRVDGIQFVDFYLNKEGFRRESGENGKYFFWSSSILRGDFDDAYAFNGESGNISNYERRGNMRGLGAVRCLALPSEG